MNIDVFTGGVPTTETITSWPGKISTTAGTVSTGGTKKEKRRRNVVYHTNYSVT